MPLIGNPVAISDLTAANVSNIIPPGLSKACLQLLAVDDDIVEGNDIFTVTAEAANTRDLVNGNASITISDNDGKNNMIDPLDDDTDTSHTVYIMKQNLLTFRYKFEND